MIIDIIFVVVALYGFWVGYSRGIIKTVMTILSILFGVMAAARFGPTVTDLLKDQLNTENSFMFLAGIILTFILTMVLFRLIGSTLEGALESVNINFINQIAGGAVMAVIMIFVYSILLSFANSSRLIDEELKQESATYTLLEPFPGIAWEAGQAVWPIFKDFWNYALDVMDRIDENVEQRESDRIFDLEDEDDGSTTY